MSPQLIVGIILAGVTVGILSSLFGVGGGILMVPFMVLALEKGQHISEGTSLLVILPTAVIGVLVHRKHDFVSFRHAGFLALGGIGGGYLGAELALNLPAETLQTTFGVLVAIVGVRTVTRGARQMRAGASLGSGESHAPPPDDGP